MQDSTARLTAALSERYRIERELGGGGMSRVFLAEELALGRTVVIKTLRPELFEGLSVERFAREVRVAARLQQANIVPVFAAGDVDGIPYYTMPYVRGESLRARLATGERIPLHEALSILRDVARALAAAHAEGIVHRDIKPENILLSGGTAVVTDFGIARAISASRTEAGVAAPQLTQTGLSIGTPAYMAPEQAAADPHIDQRADLYAWGIVAWELLAGRHPFADATTPQALLAAHLADEPLDVATMRPDVPPALNALIRAALQKDPTQRPASANAVLAALDGVTTPGATIGTATARRRPRWILGAVALVIVLVITGVILFARHPAVGPSVIRSLAVLPLDNYSGDSSQNYFAEGMTDEITTELGGIRQLHVTSRGSAMQFGGKDRPAAAAIAKALGVDALVEGSVMRSGDNVRINIELVDAPTGRQLWAESFERRSRDVLALQADLAQAIAREISVQLSPSERSRLAAAPTIDPAAHDAYLKGRYFFNRPTDENLKKAIAQFDEAVRLSPNFAPAYSGLSDAYLWAGYNEGFITASAARPKALEAAERAVQLDSNSAEAHTSLAVYKLFYEHDWAGSEREFKRAIALNPNYAFAPDQYSLLLAFTGRFDEANAQAQRAIALDPLSPQVLIDATMAPQFTGDSARTLDLAHRAAQLDPSFFFPVMSEGWLQLELGNYRAAIPFLARAAKMDAPPFVTAYLAFAHGAAGDRTAAMADLDALRTMAGGSPVLPFNLALVYLGLGDKAKAITYLEQARAADSQMLGWLGQDHIFDSLRKEPRFIALLEELKFIS
ncbi:MAG TPA: protein kinase [Gemmatimonadales bacterium]|nr:protein kinase [Gemmatimonadales bacterium]